MMRLIARLLVAALLVPFAAGAQPQGEYPSASDWMEPSGYYAETSRGNVQLRRFKSADDARAAILGRFINAGRNGVTDFYFFPNGRFAITQRCDVCQATTVATGRWRLEDGIVALTMDRSASAAALAALGERFGPLDRLAVFALARDGLLSAALLVSPAVLAKGAVPRSSYIERGEAYVDWQPIYERLGK
jgi:hypothetical protein